MNAPQRPPGPPYKWVGGKRRLLPQLLARIPADFGTYYEPFFGAGTLFWALSAQGRITSAVLADGSPVVARAMQGLRECYGGVVGALQVWAWRAQTDPEGTLRTCQEILAHPMSHLAYEVCAALLAHQSLAFNGLWRVNAQGRPNVPLGRNARGEPNQVRLNLYLLEACHEALQLAQVHHHVAFDPDLLRPTWALPEPEPGDLVYLDPPYLPLSNTADFTGYTVGGFGLSETVELARWAADCRDRGVHVLVSNSYCPAVLETFTRDGGSWVWAMDLLSRAGTVSCAGGDRGSVREVLLW